MPYDQIHFVTLQRVFVHITGHVVNLLQMNDRSTSGPQGPLGGSGDAPEVPARVVVGALGPERAGRRGGRTADVLDPSVSF